MKTNALNLLKKGIIGSAIILSSVTAQARDSFSDLIIFSGSLSDTGNISTLIGDFPPPFFENRSSNGPVAVDFFAERLGFDAEPSMHLIGLNEGNNFAVKGSRAAGDAFTDLPAQLDAYFDRTGGTADAEALYFIFIGGHDVIEATLNPDEKEGRQIIKNAVLGIEDAIHRLAEQGAENIYAPGFIDLSISPAMKIYGLSEKAHELSKFYDRKFNKMLNRVERDTGLRIFRFDFMQFVNDTMDNAGVFGFINKDDACTAQADCDFDKFIFMDETFPTSRVHDLLGNALASDLLHQLSSCKRGNWHKGSCNKK